MSRRKRSGFTLIEMTVSLVLMGLLMAGVAGVLPMCLSKLKTTSEDSSSQRGVWHRVVARLHEDLEQYPMMSLAGPRLQLSKAADANLSRLIVYELVSFRERPLLVRRVVTPELKTLSADPIAWGLGSLNFWPTAEQNTEQPASAVWTFSANSPETRPTTAVGRYELVLADEFGRELYREGVHVRSRSR